MKRPEILSPAGNFEKMRSAILYGADAVYLAGEIFGMRAAADNFSLSELSEAVGYEDIGHFRRRFRQYFGISVKDYGCINKELTLYHAKPQRRSE